MWDHKSHNWQRICRPIKQPFRRRSGLFAAPAPETERSQKAGNALQKIDEELNKTAAKSGNSSPIAGAAPAAADARPIPVEVHQPAPSTLETFSSIVTPLLYPIATIGIVVVFVIFILLQREDLQRPPHSPCRIARPPANDRGDR